MARPKAAERSPGVVTAVENLCPPKRPRPPAAAAAAAPSPAAAAGGGVNEPDPSPRPDAANNAQWV